MSEFFAELINYGGHGGYVWSAYGVTLALIVAECVALAIRRRRARERLSR